MKFRWPFESRLERVEANIAKAAADSAAIKATLAVLVAGQKTSLENQEKIMSAIDDNTAAVNRVVADVGVAVSDVTSLSQQLAAALANNPNDTAQLTALTGQLTTAAQNLEAAHAALQPAVAAVTAPAAGS